MPGKLKVKIIAGRNFPVMDRSNDTTDAFVEIKLGSVTYKTDVCRKTLNPQWNSEWYKFETDDTDLQDEPLQIRIMDYDTYSANDAIGKVYLNLHPLLMPLGAIHEPNTTSSQLKGITITGWLPVYDTMHGIRGEVNIAVKLDLFEDFNRFRQSSCGIHFFSSSMVPEGYRLKAVHGFVEELVFADDPEYQWIDKIRTPRSSNEARQTLFIKLNGQLKRKIGVKVSDIGANSIVGYKQYFDLEGESGVVLRGLGTAVTLEAISLNQGQETKKETSPLCRRSSDSDINVAPRDIFYSWRDPGHSPAGNSLVITDKVSKPHAPIQPSTIEPLDIGEYPFLTLTKYPQGFIQHIGGVVSARGVKLLSADEGESRDSWWTELRCEVRSHARSLMCNAVIAYSEQATVWEDVCILSASGTAAIVNQNPGVKQADEEHLGCSVFHVPYDELSHSGVQLSKCLQCKKENVGDILLSTADLIEGASVEEKGILIQSSVARVKRDSKGEINAKEVSDALPFMEYELHTQLMHKLCAAGLNAIVGLKVELSLGDRLLLAYATGTGVRLSALPYPVTHAENSDLVDSDEEDIGKELKELDLSSGNRETCILEIGEAGGGSVGIPPDGFLISTTQDIPGSPMPIGLSPVRNLQMFTQIWKAKLGSSISSAMITSQFHRMLQGVYFKFRGMTPCALTNLSFKVDLPQPEDLQISLVGMAVGLAENDKNRASIDNEGEFRIMDRVEEEHSAKSTPTSRSSRRSIHTPPREQRYGVDVSPLCYVPGARIVNYLGNLNFFFIRESSCIREVGGLSSFLHGFVAEVLAIVRAHVTAIGGNALLSYTMSECYLTNSAHKNQAQCLINVGGDAVFVKYSEI